MEPFDIKSFLGSVAKEAAWSELNRRFPGAAGAVTAVDNYNRISEYLKSNFSPEHGRDVAATVMVLLDELKERRNHDVKVAAAASQQQNYQQAQPQQFAQQSTQIHLCHDAVCLSHPSNRFEHQCHDLSCAGCAR